MSLFGTQFSFSAGQKAHNVGACCVPTSSIIKKPKHSSFFLDDCVSNANCCEKGDCDSQKECANTINDPSSGYVNGQRVLRPWAIGSCDCYPQVDPCTPKQECCRRRSRILDCHVTDCGSTVIQVEVQGGADQKLMLLVPLVGCNGDTLKFCARKLQLLQKKCVKECAVPCQFVQLGEISMTPSSAKVTLCLIEGFAPESILATDGPCGCPVAFTLELEFWRSDENACCLPAVETIIPPATFSCE